MRALLTLACAVLALSCRKQEAPAAAQHPGVPPGMAAAARVGSAAFHLELGGVHARYGDAKVAIEHLSQAASLAQDGAQRAQALAALARVKQDAGDADGALQALEQARAEVEKAGAGGPLAMADDELALQLPRLLAERGRTDDALRACERGLARAQQPWQREQLQRLQVDLLRRAGRLDARLAEGEKALDATSPDEASLRLLVVALGADALAPPAAPRGAPGEPQAPPRALVRACERLHALHPDDPQLRQTLVALLERAGRIDDAVTLVEAASVAGATECAASSGPQATSPAIQGLSEAARIRARAGQREKALGEAAKIAALAGREGVSAWLAAADLYREQGDGARAAEMVRRAAADARSIDDRRRVAFARASQLAGDRKAVDVLYGEWERSSDPCLRQAAAHRRAMATAMAAQTAMAPPAPAR